MSTPNQVRNRCLAYLAKGMIVARNPYYSSRAYFYDSRKRGFIHVDTLNKLIKGGWVRKCSAVIIEGQSAYEATPAAMQKAQDLELI